MSLSPRIVQGWLMLLAATLLMGNVQAQTPFSANSTMAESVEDVLHQMSDKADIVFIGHVAAIRPHEDDGTGAGSIEVDFDIEQAIRGCAGGAYVLREWAGLWSGDAHRYRVGQRLLMMLHAPGADGLSSPIGGMDGAIPIRGVADASALTASAANAPVPVADLRWLGAKVAHPTSYVLQRAISPAPLNTAPWNTGQQMASGDNLIVNPDATNSEGDTSARASTPAQQASVETVVKLLTSWNKATGDVR
jgi:hypothetical protein